MRSTSWYCNDSSIIQILYSIKRFTCRSSYGDLKYFALVKLSGAYVPSLFQHLLNHTSISGEGPNWHNILFKFNVSCKIDYYAKDPMSICIWTKECSCRIFFYWISFRSRQVFSFAPEQKAKKPSLRFCLQKSWR